MKIDQEYLKGLLEVFENAEEPTIDVNELEELGFNTEDSRLIFHLQLLADQGFVKREDGRHGLGYTKGADGHVTWFAIPLRLTSQGHTFIEALRNSDVWNTVKSEFKEASMSTMYNVSKKLLEGYTKKKLTELLSFDKI